MFDCKLKQSSVPSAIRQKNQDYILLLTEHVILKSDLKQYMSEETVLMHVFVVIFTLFTHK